MASINKVFSFADDVVRYAKVCGKRNILQTKPLQGKIDPNKLGFRLPDGRINFTTQEGAIEYGIERCRLALLGPKPFERGICIKGRTVVAEIQGTAGGVKLHHPTEVMIHGHPDTYAKGCATALSAGDYKYFIDNNCCKRMLAVNSKGEFYQMTKKPGADFSLYSKYTNELMEEFQYSNFIPIQAESLPLQRLPKWIVDNTHKFWMKNRSMLKADISTNFSNFVNVLD